MNRPYHRLRQRLKYTEEWVENFLDVERHKEISKKALHEHYKKSPILSFFFRFYLIPTSIIYYFSDIIWWNRYCKWCKEVELIKKELESYE